MSLYRIPVSYILVVKVLHSNVLKRLNLVLKVSEVLRSFKAVSCENLSLIQLIKTNKITKRLESTTNKSATNSSIPENKKNENPKGLFTKLKYYFKKYWYIAIPIHIVGCALWFITFYLVVRRLILFSGIITFFSGVDVVAILEYLNLPDSWVNKVKNTPPSASYLVAAMLLYKIATPIRYLSTIANIQLAFRFLRKFGLLRPEGGYIRKALKARRSPKI